MKPEFYRQCADYANARHPGIKFAIQTNLLAYKSTRWKDVFQTVFEGRISTSYDPYKKYRTVKGSADSYDRLFWRSMDAVIGDGFRPLVIGVYDEGAAPAALEMYDLAKSYGVYGFDIRLNYAYPAGRVKDSGMLIKPRTYGQMLIDLYDRWLTDLPTFNITPLDQMLQKVAGYRSTLCPWTKSCGGKFLTIDPDGSVYNCSEFSDLGDRSYCFGNILTGEVVDSSTSELKIYNSMEVVPALAASSPSLEIMRRQLKFPVDCKSCAHFSECEGGCARDSVLFERGMGGKFGYCESWKMVFTRLKSSVASGEADKLLLKLGVTPADARARVSALKMVS